MYGDKGGEGIVYGKRGGMTMEGDRESDIGTESPIIKFT